MAVTDAAIDKIKQMILSGELAPGSRLPKEADLAGRLGLSRNSLREAVRALALINVLDVRQGDGTYVTSLKPDLLLDAMAFVTDFHRDDTVLQFFQVRRILEPEATALAATEMTGSGIAELREILGSLPEDPSVEQLVDNDLRFHRRIAEGSGNAVLCSLLASVSGPTTRARIWRGLIRENPVDRTREQHAAICEAIASRRPEVARAWATVHIADAEERLRRALSGEG
ncbi:GntR family transcriptional regulator [Planobispora rosea]|uniref:GntR family transcriptional regulator n=1 Tax=Planobispora rosea TaxID=35762 RepID=A0A8J3WGF1_PLARO|nr:FadR/GntR family transcriptional regulator [Planobispora rosea]GGS57914.1 GntR family transcriptional regulator [Planobispora rosea]GIH88475.1 GntR family transcriptional regulator [Planobispora rosea]